MIFSGFVQKLRNYCTVICDEGMSYSDYVEQLTYLLFLWTEKGESSGGRGISLHTHRFLAPLLPCESLPNL